VAVRNRTERTAEAQVETIRILLERCTDCGCCIEVCPSDALAREGGAVILAHPEDCGGCGQCELICPEDAIEVSFSIVWDNEPTGEQGEG